MAVAKEKPVVEEKRLNQFTDPINWDLARTLYVQGKLSDREIMSQVGCKPASYFKHKTEEDWNEKRKFEEKEVAKTINELIEGSRFKWYAQSIRMFLRLSDTMERMTVKGDLKSVEAWQRVFEKHISSGRTLFGFDNTQKTSAGTLVNVNVQTGNGSQAPTGVVMDVLSEDLTGGKVLPSPNSAT